MPFAVCRSVFDVCRMKKKLLKKFARVALNHALCSNSSFKTRYYFSYLLVGDLLNYQARKPTKIFIINRGAAAPRFLIPDTRIKAKVVYKDRSLFFKVHRSNKTFSKSHPVACNKNFRFFFFFIWLRVRGEEKGVSVIQLFTIRVAKLFLKQNKTKNSFYLFIYLFVSKSKICRK